MRLSDRLLDIALLAIAPLSAPFLYLAAHRRCELRLTRSFQDLIGVTVVENHYYEPVFTSRDVKFTNNEPRLLPGIDLNYQTQFEILELFHFGEELRDLENQTVRGIGYHYSRSNSTFAEGDAEALYSFIRAFKPKNIVEIGCGRSTVVAELAIQRNKDVDPNYHPQHLCFEPFENPWLESLGLDVRRERIEHADLSLFSSLGPNDIVFIDSSHVLRPQGDVEFEVLRILPVLQNGVFVHFHDVFTPRDYLKSFIHDDRRFWTEQYILEAFLSLNPHFEIVLAVNDLHRLREERLYRAFPMLAAKPEKNPGSFWIRRRPPAAPSGRA